MKLQTWLAGLLLAVTGVSARAAETAPAPAPGGYLFAHMTHARYGVLHYAVSTDGLHWKRLNRGKAVNEEYHGHPSIVQGGDGRYYLVGNQSDEDKEIRFWVSDDLVKWTKFGTYQPDLATFEGQPHPLQAMGAPKLFYDKASSRFVLMWHTPNVPGSKEDPERFWASQRTMYVTSKDLREFVGPPKRLFDWDMATIDVSLVENPAGGYCALLKDERYPSYNWTTGKTIRMSCGPSLLGPYPPPGPSLSPAFREAPTLIRAPNGVDWLLYYEQYAGTSYGLSMAPRLEGPWVEVWGNSGIKEWNKFEMPATLRHGFMMAVSAKQLEALTKAFPE